MSIFADQISLKLTLTIEYKNRNIKHTKLTTLFFSLVDYLKMRYLKKRVNYLNTHDHNYYTTMLVIIG